MSEFAGTAAAEAIRAALERCNAGAAFGLPGGPNQALFQILTTATPRLIVPSHELAAAFMAGTYGRITGRPGTLLTIPGPGFAFALPGIAEAWQDSAPLVHIVGAAPEGAHHRHRHQALEQSAIVRPMAKALFATRDVSRIGQLIGAAFETAAAGDPGPVIVQLGLEEEHPAGAAPAPAEGAVAQAWARIRAAQRPVLMLGQGCAESAGTIAAFIERTGTPVFTSASGRGVIPEDSPWCLGYDSLKDTTEELNALLDQADLVIVVGARLAYNGTGGFGLRLPPERLAHIDPCAANLNAVYPAGCTAVATAEEFFARPECAGVPRTQWTTAMLAPWRTRISSAGNRAEPIICGVAAPEFFAGLRAQLPDTALVVTDSGLHQVMARRHFQVLSPHGLLLPSDLQSMGFGVPSAIAARLAAPTRPVVALVGDGGMFMSGLELATAVRENIALTVIVFSDGYLNQIRMQQLGDTGHDHGVTLPVLDFQALAAAVGAQYVDCASADLACIGRAIRSPGVTLVEVPVADGAAVVARVARSRAKGVIRRALGPRPRSLLRRWLGK